MAEIEKFEKALKNACKPNPFGNVEECMTAAELQSLDVVKETIDTLEVKEVDLEKELDEWVKYGPHTNYPWCTIPDAIKITAEHFYELGLKAKDWKEERTEECPYRQVGCTMYEDKVLKCEGVCSWVVDYPKLKELKAQKGE